ncbi:MAG: holo-ACP synthase [Pseudomonadota bacterium]
MAEALQRPRWLPAVGIDLVQVCDVQQALSQHGDVYLKRLYTSDEIEYSRRSASEMPRRLAARFAAKEATLKVLRPTGHWLDWRLIEVTRTEHGHCEIELHGAAAALADEQGIGALSVSFSHENDLAVAVVMGLRHRSEDRKS